MNRLVELMDKYKEKDILNDNNDKIKNKYFNNLINTIE